MIWSLFFRVFSVLLEASQLTVVPIVTVTLFVIGKEFVVASFAQLRFSVWFFGWLPLLSDLEISFSDPPYLVVLILCRVLWYSKTFRGVGGLL